LEIIKKKYPLANQTTIGEFGCAQANLSLILAELGYEVFAIDREMKFLEYSKLKYQKGNIKWIHGQIDDPNLSVKLLNIAVLGEVIEHCAFPEDIIKNVLKYVSIGGLLIITTPNGSRFRNRLPTYAQISKKEKKDLIKKQFGPGGEDHLFLFRSHELKRILPKNIKIIGKGYTGSTILINRFTYNFLKLLPIHFLELIIRQVSKIPLINTKFYNNIFLILIKTF